MYLGFVLIRYEEVTDAETTASKEEFSASNSQEEGAPGLVRRQDFLGESVAQSLYCVFCEKEWVRQGTQV